MIVSLRFFGCCCRLMFFDVCYCLFFLFLFKVLEISASLGDTVTSLKLSNSFETQ